MTRRAVVAAITVLVWSGCDDGGLPDATVVRIDPATGAHTWVRSIEAPRFGNARVVFGQLAVSGREHCTALPAGDFAFDAVTGEPQTSNGELVSDVTGGDAVSLEIQREAVTIADAITAEARWSRAFPCQFQEAANVCAWDWQGASIAGALVMVSYNPATVGEVVLAGWTRLDGLPVWEADFSGAYKVTAARNQPTTPGTMIVFVNGNGGPDRVVALDPLTGVELWRHDVVSSLADGLAVPLFEPTRTSDVVVFRDCHATGTGCGLVALDAAAGTVRWRVTTHLADRSAVNDTGVYTLVAGALVGLEPSTSDPLGEIRWQVPIDAASSLNVAADGERAYAVTADAMLLAVEVSTGAPVWQSQLPDGISANEHIQIVASGDAVYVIGVGELPACD